MRETGTGCPVSTASEISAATKTWVPARFGSDPGE